MLTVDLVHAYRRGTTLKLRELKGADRERARELAAEYIAMARACVGRTRSDLEEACAAVRVEARHRKLALGLRKLVMDRCEFEVESGPDPALLRRAVFERASAARQALGPGERLDRELVLAEVARAHGLETGELERCLYMDLRSAHRVLSFAWLGADALIELYIAGQAQAVLLRAVDIVARVSSSSPAAYRALFHKLKFLRLLYLIEPTGEGGYEITIDGPGSLFRSVTKYGLKLALLLPALDACEEWSITARVQWGKRRETLSFVLASRASDEARPAEAARMPAEVEELLHRFEERFAQGQSAWQAQPCTDILPLPGVGLCVPDLLFTHAGTGECVYLEVLGFWSRQAVWRRVELVERGLPQSILFAVSSRLRVSEAALDASLPGALYVYKGTMSARAIEERLDALVSRSHPRPA